MQPDSLENRLLQLCAVQRSIRTIQKLQRVQNNAARIVLQALLRSDVNSLIQTLHSLPVKQRINYKFTSWPC